MPTKKPKVETTGKYATLHVNVVVKEILDKESARRVLATEGARKRSASLGRLLAEAISIAWDNPDYNRMLREAGLIE